MVTSTSRLIGPVNSCVHSQQLNPSKQTPVHCNGLGLHSLVSKVTPQHVRYDGGREFLARGGREQGLGCRAEIGERRKHELDSLIALSLVIQPNGDDVLYKPLDGVLKGNVPDGKKAFGILALRSA